MTGPLFAIGPVQARELEAADVPALQVFFEENPEYSLAVNGAPPSSDEARSEFDDVPPADMPYAGRWRIGFHDEEGRLIAFAGVLSDFLAPRVWHIGIYIVATSLHGTGTARAFYDALEAWMAAGGARWIRLGVVEGNAKAEKFWSRLGFVEVRQRTGVRMGERTNTVRVLVKTLSGDPLGDYLAMVKRDDPASSLP